MRRLALANIIFHLIGLAFGATLMRPGSIAEPLLSRHAWLATHPLGWRLGWAVWMLAALAYVAFIERLVRHVPSARLALLLGAMGAGVDLLCDSVQMLVLPLIASGTEAQGVPFAAWERFANAGGLVVANGLYSLAVAVATIEIRGRAVRALAAVTFLAGSAMVVGGLLDSAPLVVLSAGPTILAYCAWVLAVARAAEQAPS